MTTTRTERFPFTVRTKDRKTLQCAVEGDPKSTVNKEIMMAFVTALGEEFGLKRLKRNLLQNGDYEDNGVIICPYR